MLLIAPRLGLTAPVLAGVSEGSLDLGIGHLPESAWPDQGGTDVLEAHDVTFFAHIDQLHAGDLIRLIAPCRQWSYLVTTHAVIGQGTPLPAAAAPTLFLVTCWPTNALFFTRQRYVVSARLTAVTTTSRIPTGTVHEPAAPVAGLPASLRSAELSVDTFGVPLGRLAVAGAVNPDWRQSAGPLRASAAATTVFDAALLTLREGRVEWWHILAPSVPIGETGALRSDPYPGYQSPLEITVDALGSNVTGVSLQADVTVSGTAYRLTVDESVRSDVLHISNWILMPTGG
jgi:sortase A